LVIFRMVGGDDDLCISEFSIMWWYSGFSLLFWMGQV